MRSMASGAAPRRGGSVSRTSEPAVTTTRLLGDQVLHRVRRVGGLPEDLYTEVRLVVQDDLEALRPRHDVQVDVDPDLRCALREGLREQEARRAARRDVQRGAE